MPTGFTAYGFHQSAWEGGGVVIVRRIYVIIFLSYYILLSITQICEELQKEPGCTIPGQAASADRNQATGKHTSAGGPWPIHLYSLASTMPPLNTSKQTIQRGKSNMPQHYAAFTSRNNKAKLLFADTKNIIVVGHCPVITIGVSHYFWRYLKVIVIICLLKLNNNKFNLFMFLVKECKRKELKIEWF